MIVSSSILLDHLLNQMSKTLHICCQFWSLHGFQTSFFIGNQFGCKLWLQSIQNYVRDCFQALLTGGIAIQTPEWLCWLIGTWADQDALFVGPAVNKDLLFCIYLIQNILILFLCHILLWGQWMIGRLSKAMSAVLVCQGPSSLRASLSPRQNFQTRWSWGSVLNFKFWWPAPWTSPKTCAMRKYFNSNPYPML